MDRADARPARALTKRILGGIAAALVSTALIGSAFVRPSFAGGFSLTPRFPLGEWLHDLPRLLPWVLIFALASAAMAPLRAFRWKFTLPRPVPRYSDRYHAVAIGLLGNNAIPGKLGEALRALTLTRFVERRGGKLPFTQALGTILVCKLLDIFALLVLVALSPAGPLWGGADVAGGLTGVAIALPALSILLVLVARNAARMASWLDARGRFPRLAGTLRGIGSGIGATSPRRLALGALASIAAVAAVSLGYGALLHGAGVAAGLSAGTVVLAAVTLGQSPPGIPAGLGMYYLSCSWAARAVGATPAQAAAIAVLSHLTTVLTHASVGAVSLLMRRLRFSELLTGGKLVTSRVALGQVEQAALALPESA